MTRYWQGRSIYERVQRCEKLLSFWRWTAILLIGLLILASIQLIKLDRLCRDGAVSVPAVIVHPPEKGG